MVTPEREAGRLDGFVVGVFEVDAAGNWARRFGREDGEADEFLGGSAGEKKEERQQGFHERESNSL